MKYQPTFQRSWVRPVRDAIAQYLAAGCDGSHEVAGYTILVSRESDTPNNEYKIGLYLPGSTPEGTCDGYYRCTADGETV